MSNSRNPGIWSEAFGAGPGRIDDEFISRLIRMFRARARLFQLISTFLLVGTGIIIAVGVRIFLVGDPEVDVLAEEEVQLNLHLIKKQEEIDQLGASAAQSQAKGQTLKRAELLSTILWRVKMGASQLLVDSKSSTVKSTQSVLMVARRISEAVNSNASHADDSITIVVSALEPTDSNQFPKNSVDKIRTIGEAKGIDWQRLNADILTFATLLDAVASGKLEEGRDSYPEMDLARLRAELNQLKDIQRLDSLHAAVVQESKAALEESQQLSAAAEVRESKRVQLEKEKADIERRLTKVRERREKILFMAWVPGLTLRVGTVVLLLFLTQILLSTYRYTIALSAFYLARSDAIQLMMPHPDNPRRYVPEQLQMLMEALTPSRYQIDPIKDPTDHVTDLAKTWINRK